MKGESKTITINKTDEIDLIDVFGKIWDQRNVIYKSIAAFFLFGLIVAFASPKEYKSEVTLLVETSAANSGMSSVLQQFGGLAGLGGLGSAMGEEALTPELYPDIVSSTPFLLEILDESLTDSKYDSTLKTSEFLDRHTRQGLGQFIMGNTFGLPGKLIGLIKGSAKGNSSLHMEIKKTPITLSPSQNGLLSELSSRIKAKQGKSPNTLIVTVKMQDPRLAAQLADSVVRSLTAYITEYRTQKAKNDLKFVEQSHHEAEIKYQAAQHALASFKDRNVNIVTASGQITEQNLQSNYTLAFNLYNTISQQLEQAKLKVQEKTPVFKVIEPSKVPLSKSNPGTTLILFAMVFLGGLTGVGVIIVKLVLKGFKEQVTRKNET